MTAAPTTIAARLLHAPLRLPWLTLLVMAGLTVALGLQLPKLRSDVRPEKVFPERDPRLAVYERFTDIYGKDDETAFVVLEMPGNVLEADALERVHELTEALDVNPLVDYTELTSLSRATFARVVEDDALELKALYEPHRREGWDAAAVDAVLREHPAFRKRLVSDDRRLASFLIPMAPGERDEKARTAFAIEMKKFFSESLREGERAWLEGFAITNHSVLSLLRDDSRRFYPVAGGLILLALIVLFRRAEPVILTVIVLVASAVWTLGIMAAADIPLSYLSTAVPVMILVVCVGDSIHLVSRYYQLLAAGSERGDALRAAVADVGIACLFTSMTTATGFLSLVLSQVELVRELGVPMAIGVMAAWLLSFTVLPPLRHYAPAPPTGASVGGLGALGALMDRLAGLVRRRPGAVALWSIALGVAASATIPMIRVESRLLQDFDEDEPLMATRIFIEEHMGGVAPLEVLIEADEPGRVLDPDVQEALFELTKRMRGERFEELGVLFALSLPDYLADMYHTLENRRPGTRRLPPEPTRAALSQLLLGYEMADPDPTTDVIDFDRKTVRLQLRVKNLYTPAFFELVRAVQAEARGLLPSDVRVEVTGMTLMAQAINESLVLGMLESFGLAFLVVLGLVAVFFRSLRLTLVAVLPNLLPILCIMAFMALTGIELKVSTSIVFSIVFGIAVDDTIHYVAGLHHQVRSGRPLVEAVGAATRETGAALVLTSIVLCGGFSVLWLSHFKANHYFGLLASLTVVFALIGDLLLLPALVILTGREKPSG